MEYEPGHTGYIEPSKLVSSIQQQHEKPLEQAAACRTILTQIEADARIAYRSFLDVIARDRHSTIEQVIDDGRDLIYEAKRKELLQSIERCREPIWYHAFFLEGVSGYFTGIPTDYIEGTLTGPLPQPEMIIEQDIAKVEELVQKVSIDDLGILTAWVKSYWISEPQQFPEGFNQLANDAEQILKYLSWIKYAMKPIFDLYAILQRADESTATASSSQVTRQSTPFELEGPYYASAPIPWDCHESILMELFEYLVKNEYVYKNCVQKFDEIVAPHFLIEGNLKPFRSPSVKIIWRGDNINLVALFEGMTLAGCMSRDENVHFATYMKENFLDDSGKEFKPKNLRSQKCTSESGKTSYRRMVKLFKSILESIIESQKQASD